MEPEFVFNLIKNNVDSDEYEAALHVILQCYHVFAQQVLTQDWLTFINIEPEAHFFSGGACDEFTELVLISMPVL